jgi:HCOMODA/2-hydroxy-3-carboxy-muconic semialdehyde decarboxylase
MLRPVCHTCGFLPQTVPIFEIRDVAGAGTDLLICTGELGRNLAAAMGEENLVLMRGHGSTIVGASVPQAVYRAVYTEINAKVLAAANALGPVTYISEQEARAIEEGAHIQVERTWEFWVDEVFGALPSGRSDAHNGS